MSLLTNQYIVGQAGSGVCNNTFGQGSIVLSIRAKGMGVSAWGKVWKPAQNDASFGDSPITPVS